MFVAGIDGGGTHTRLELRDLENRPLGRWEFGPFNLNSIGETAFRQLLRQVFAHCGGMADCASLCVGAAGISNPAVGDILLEELEKAGFSGRLALKGDQEIALRGAMDGPGVALIAGTGSIAFGKNAQGQTARAGGYGHLIDDEGSGYALGRDVLRCAIRSQDRRSGSEILQQAVEERLGPGPENLVKFVYSPRTDKSAIAKFSALALEHSAADRSAQGILEKGAQELSALVAAVQKKLGLPNSSIALLGGLLTEDNPYRQTVAQTLSSLGTPIHPQHDPLWGAAQTAWEML